MTRQDTIPTADRLRSLLEAATSEAVTLLGSTSTDNLLTTHAALTHKLHAAESKPADSSVMVFLAVQQEITSLRAQRDLIRAEILTRTGDL